MPEGEPDIRCEYCEHIAGAGNRFAQAIGVVVFPWGHRRLLCRSHLDGATRDLGEQARIEPLIRSPLPIALFCSALHGSWSPRQCALLAQMLDPHASDADRAGAAMALLDMAEDAGWQELGRLPRVEREWLPTLRSVVLPILDGVSASRPAHLVGRTWDEVFAGNVTWSVGGGWLVRVFNDCNSWDYIDSLVTPDGREIDYDDLPDAVRFWQPSNAAGWPSLPKSMARQFGGKPYNTTWTDEPRNATARPETGE